MVQQLRDLENTRAASTEHMGQGVSAGPAHPKEIRWNTGRSHLRQVTFLLYYYYGPNENLKQ